MRFLRQPEHYCIDRRMADGILNSAQLRELVTDRDEEWCDEHGHNAYVRVVATLTADGWDLLPATLVVWPSQNFEGAVNVLVHFRDDNGNILAGEDMDLIDLDADDAPEAIYNHWHELTNYAATWGAAHPHRSPEL